LNISPVATIGN